MKRDSNCMKRMIVLLLVLVSCSQSKKENKSEFITHITDSISKEVELKVRAKIKDSLEMYRFKSDEEEYLSKLSEVNFYKWKKKYLSTFSPEKEDGFATTIIRNTFDNLEINYKRKIKLHGIYKGKDEVINSFFEAVTNNCPEKLSIFKDTYELNLDKDSYFFPISALSEDLLNKLNYDCFCNNFNKAEVIKKDTIYSFEIFRGDCRGVEVFSRNKE